MTAKELAEALSLNIVTLPDPEAEVQSGYVGDMPSWVMGYATEGSAWVTILNNRNIVAVAVLLEMACVIVTEGAEVSEEVAAVAKDRNVNLFSTTESSFRTVARMAELL
ncbi:MAG: hypothetical protein IJ720_01240 [Clostridia bacterium]|nr:hypothetical protein [Clostridia bacterium]MBQ8469260.1 hypothetical protein [Clostridia bacterium]MBR1703972.1 hypothetical protein [Clostridia bacterium]